MFQLPGILIEMGNYLSPTAKVFRAKCWGTTEMYFRVTTAVTRVNTWALLEYLGTTGVLLGNTPGETMTLLLGGNFATVPLLLGDSLLSD